MRPRGQRGGFFGFDRWKEWPFQYQDIKDATFMTLRDLRGHLSDFKAQEVALSSKRSARRFLKPREMENGTFSTLQDQLVATFLIFPSHCVSQMSWTTTALDNNSVKRAGRGHHRFRSHFFCHHGQLGKVQQKPSLPSTPLCYATMTREQSTKNIAQAQHPNGGD
jgi:hypothetical protein